MHNSNPSCYVKWAREVLDSYFENREPIPPYDPKLSTTKAACFVTLHNKDGNLRGCIGSILPTRHSLVEEIRDNAISAAIRDPRFMPLTKEELQDVDISVDVLSDPVLIKSTSELDPSKFGIIVTAGNRQGVLLPDIPGVRNIEDQIQITMQKAGIQPGTPVEIYKFTVERYH